MKLKLFDQLDELFLLFKSSKNVSLMIRYRTHVFLLCSNNFFDDGGEILQVLQFFDFFKSSVSTFPLSITETTNSFLISSFLSLLVLVALSDTPFVNYEQK